MKKPTIICAADLTFAPETKRVLESQGLVKYISPTPQALLEHLPDGDAYFASLHVQLSRELIEISPRLKVIATPSTGLDHLDLQAAAQHGIVVLGLKDDRQLLDRITATAELAWALLLACARSLPAACQASRQGHWARDLFRGHQLAYKTLGILGCGRLGTIISQYGQAFRMRVLGCDKLPVTIPGVQMVSLDQLLHEADVLTIHIHLTQENHHLINGNILAKMKRGAILINTSRGAILNETDLLESLESGHVSAAGLDVLDGEWNDNLAEHPLIVYSRSHENLIITPHIGGVTYESQEMAYTATAQKLVEFFKNLC
ncbi:MAG: NAD(P)-dependent oxidoreductase [Phycisphaerae bacterium]